MKKAFLFLISGFFIALQCTGTVRDRTAAALPAALKPDILQLKETGYNFGKIPQGRPVIHVFEISQYRQRSPLCWKMCWLPADVPHRNGVVKPSPRAAQHPSKWDIMPMGKVILTKQLQFFTTTDKRKR